MYDDHTEAKRSTYTLLWQNVIPKIETPRKLLILNEISQFQTHIITSQVRI